MTKNISSCNTNDLFYDPKECKGNEKHKFASFKNEAMRYLKMDCNSGPILANNNNIYFNMNEQKKAFEIHGSSLGKLCLSNIVPQELNRIGKKYGYDVKLIY